MAEPRDENQLGRAIDFALGMLSDEEREAALEEASRDPRFEDLLRRQCAAVERNRAETCFGERQSPNSGSSMASRARFARPRPRNLALAATVLAACLALVFIFRGSPEPDLYWLPVDAAFSTQRGPASGPDDWQEGVRLYASHDLEAAVEALRTSAAEGSSRDLANLYLASSLLNLGQRDEAAEVLGRIDLETLPHPWRGYGRELARRLTP